MKKTTVSRFLLDTHTFLWWITDSPSLSPGARELIANPKNEILLSAVSGWEIAIKASIGKLSEIGDPELAIPFHAERNSFNILEFSILAALRVYKLPQLHQDPFDRALIAQAQLIEVPIITKDPKFDEYDIATAW